MATKSGKPERKRTLRPEPTPRAPQPSRAKGAPPKPAAGAPPEITVRREPVGRETLAAIVEDLAAHAPPKARPKLDTLGYEDRPRARAPSDPPRSSAPELITVEHAPVGRATQAAIEDALIAETARALDPAPTGGPAPAGGRSPEQAEIFEIDTFVVQGEEIFTKVSEQSRRDFVEKRLLHRLAALSMDEVVRIDVSRGATAETVILRIWSKVGRPPA